MKKVARRALAALLLPLSAVPVALAVPPIMDTYRSFERNHESGPLASGPVRLSAADRGLERLPAHPRSVPVLAYDSVDRRQLGQHLALLRRLGYHSISAQQYARFRRGEMAGLPRRPVLITFDRGLLSTYRKADRLLARTRMRATIFVETSEIQAKDPRYLRWNELKDMQASARWDVETYGHDAHTEPTIDREGRSAPFYAARRYTRSRGLETLPDFEQRATLDIFRAKQLLREHGLRPLLFSLPDRDYSRKATNDPRTLELVDGLVERQFATHFESADRSPAFNRAKGPAGRLLLDRDAAARDLYEWLELRNPALARRKARRA